ncbi:FAD-binding oxidoreductase [Lichenihabitans psoromatis]|uniref:FAD-binding oxidoreductase n=1 Tax=Lichenihabitans psoromatis TaxID=2528642 RepID=UPI00103837C1|nr:FAD-binding oxidoreductase [Lichenihabitans psoromatis]
MDALTMLLDDPSLRVPAADLDRYSTDWSRDLSGTPRAVVRPRTTADVASMVRECAARGLPIVPQGGHTGLVGGATPSKDGSEVVISLERLNAIREIDPVNFSMTVEAGCILENIHAAAAAEDCLFPLQLSAQGSCQIGGNIASNAGGLNVVRYGMTRDLVLGLEVVLPDGRIWNGLRKLRKNNTGYDLKQLFIGSEGTLGIITAASLKLFPKPSQIETAFLAVDSPDQAVALFGRARRDLSDLLSAFELLPRRGVELALEVMPGLRDPLSGPSPYYVLMEVAASGLVHLKGLVETFLEGAVESALLSDGTLAANGAQAAEFWRIREGIIEAQARRGRHLRTDVSVPISSLTTFLDAAHADLLRAEPDVLPLAYGHLGDGNIHFNVVPPSGLSEADKTALLHRCEVVIFGLVDRLGGSISAEHGIGRVKRAAFQERSAPLDLDLLRRIKAVIDPNRLMNPGRMFD